MEPIRSYLLGQAEVDSMFFQQMQKEAPKQEGVRTIGRVTYRVFNYTDFAVTMEKDLLSIQSLNSKKPFSTRGKFNVDTTLLIAVCPSRLKNQVEIVWREACDNELPLQTATLEHTKVYTII